MNNSRTMVSLITRTTGQQWCDCLDRYTSPPPFPPPLGLIDLFDPRISEPLERSKLFLAPVPLGFTGPTVRVGAIMAASVRKVGAKLLNRRLRNQITDRDTAMPMHYLWPMPRASYTYADGTHTRREDDILARQRGERQPCGL